NEHPERGNFVVVAVEGGFFEGHALFLKLPGKPGEEAKDRKLGGGGGRGILRGRFFAVGGFFGGTWGFVGRGWREGPSRPTTNDEASPAKNSRPTTILRPQRLRPLLRHTPLPMKPVRHDGLHHVLLRHGNGLQEQAQDVVPAVG